MQFNQQNNNRGDVFNAISGEGNVSQVTGLRIITEPSVFLVGRQTIDGDGMEGYLADIGFQQWCPDADDEAPESQVLVEIAARTCYQSFTGKGRPHEEHLKHLLEVGHGSCLEHAVWNFIFTGISRSLSHELVRHRHFSFSQLSQRYVDESDVAFVVPPAHLASCHAWAARKALCGNADELKAEREKHQLFLSWKTACEVSLSYYREHLAILEAQAPPELTGTERRKWAHQAARSVLPNCTETKIFVTANARALRHFIEMRASRHADVEIRRLACKLHEVLVREAPALFGDYRRLDLADGTYELITDYRKV